MKKKASPKQADTLTDMRPEYDFSGGVRGKHYKILREGYTIRVHKTDGTIIEKSVGGRDSVTLAPDVREYFPTSRAVNHALRTLISIVPRKRKATSQKERIGKSSRKLVAKSRSKRER